jgi:hypothetical protein
MLSVFVLEADQTGFHHAVEGGVDLRGFDVPILLATHERSKPRAQFITVAGLLSQKT